MVQAIAVAEHVQKTGAAYVAHGSTGAGNDQVRFDMVFQSMLPGVEILTPIRDLKLSREEEISFLKENGVDMNVAKAKYSINKGLWGTSVGGKETLTSKEYLPEDAWPTPVTETGTRELVFLCGDAEGFPEELRAGSRQKISLSTLTMPHEFARVVLAEQIYRAFAILAGHPYPK